MSRHFDVSERTVRHAMKHDAGEIRVRCSMPVEILIERKKRYGHIGRDCTPAHILRAMAGGVSPARTAADVQATRRRQFIERGLKSGLSIEVMEVRASRMFG